MIAAKEHKIESIGTIQIWERGSAAPQETPFVADLGWKEPASSVCSAWLRGLIVSDPTPLVSTRATHDACFQMGRVWMPWAFTPSPSSEVTVSSVGMGVMATGLVLFAKRTELRATTVVPMAGLLRLMNPGQLTVETTPLWDEADEIRLLAPGLLPRRLRVRETVVLPKAAADARVAEALAAIDDVGRWLNRSQREVAELCRFSLRALRYWGSGSASPRPSTVRHLHEVHAFLRSLMLRIGAASVRDWLAQPAANGAVRLEVLSNEDGTKMLLREAAPLLFVDVRMKERMRPELALTAAAEELADHYAPVAPEQPPRRARRVPPPAE